MKLEEAIEYFGSQRKLADALGVTPGLISQIKAAGEIPENHQWKLQGISGGALKVDTKYRPAA